MARGVLDDILDGLDRWHKLVRIIVMQTKGSTPRDTGAAMIVVDHDITGTIGGGQLEFQAINKAREILSNGLQSRRLCEEVVLGPQLRQCCGGTASLLFEYYDQDDRASLLSLRAELTSGDLILHPLSEEHGLKKIPQSKVNPHLGGKTADGFLEPAFHPVVPLYIYGAGHVGRALVRVLEGSSFDITWVDTAEDRFSAVSRPGVNKEIVTSQADYAKTVCRDDAFHVVMTYSHEADLDICRTVLLSGKGRYLGLIASKTKKARFLLRLKEDGVGDGALNIFRCPIGLKLFNRKDPTSVAISIAAELLEALEK